jgi:5-methylcytosine-specific restriction endonuclease McrA
MSCRFCHGDIALSSRRTSYCSDPCEHEFRLLNETSYARAHVLLRDRGVCAECGVDTIGELPAGWRRPEGSMLPVSRRALSIGAWEMDHIVEVARGGTSALSNLQTLCRKDHLAKTARFAAERAAERRLSKTGFQAEDHDPERPRP